MGKLKEVISLVLILSPIILFGQLETKPKKDPFAKITGSMQLSASYFQSNYTNTFPELTLLATANATITTKYVSLPFSLVVSNQQLDFRQPFNQFGISPTFKWFKLNLGYRNLNFGKYTLAGHSMLGAGFEITRDRWEAGFNYGRLLKATPFDTSTTLLRPVSFERFGYAARLKYKMKKGFVGFSMLSAKDNPNSLNQPDTFFSESGIKVYPAQNVVTEFEVSIPFLKRFKFEGNIAGSVYTQDVKSSMTVEDTTLLDAGVPKFIVNGFELNGTSNAYTALNSKLTYTSKSSRSIGVDYRRISPEFKSMGTYFFQSDLENITLNVSTPMMKRKVYFSGSIGTQRDNLNNIKQSTAKRIIGSANMNYTGQKFGLGINFYNYTINQNPTITLLGDSLKIVQTTNNLSVIPRYFYNTEKHRHNFVFVSNLSQLKDYNRQFSSSEAFRIINTMSLALSHGFSRLTKEWTVNYGVNYMLIDDPLNPNYSTIGGNFGASNKYIKKKLLAGFNLGVFSSENQGRTGMIFNAGLNFNYQFTKKLYGGINIFNTTSTNIEDGSSKLGNQFRGDFRIGMNFY